MTKHLWEYDHPYYCNEGNYHAIDHHDEVDSWAEFVADSGWFDSDLDMNLLFRWDWKSPTRSAGYDPSDYADDGPPADELPRAAGSEGPRHLGAVPDHVVAAPGPHPGPGVTGDQWVVPYGAKGHLVLTYRQIVDLVQHTAPAPEAGDA